MGTAAVILLVLHLLGSGLTDVTRAVALVQSVGSVLSSTERCAAGARALSVYPRASNGHRAVKPHKRG
jgi:hypothetical protein